MLNGMERLDILKDYFLGVIFDLEYFYSLLLADKKPSIGFFESHGFRITQL
jgi:hypothetical protein